MPSADIPVSTRFKKANLRATVIRCMCGHLETHPIDPNGAMLPCPQGRREPRGIIATSGWLPWERFKDFIVRNVTGRKEE